jgi:hypothetical protein
MNTKFDDAIFVLHDVQDWSVYCPFSHVTYCPKPKQNILLLQFTQCSKEIGKIVP